VSDVFGDYLAVLARTTNVLLQPDIYENANLLNRQGRHDVFFAGVSSGVSFISEPVLLCARECDGEAAWKSLNQCKLLDAVQPSLRMELCVRYRLKMDFESGAFIRALPPLRVYTSPFLYRLPGKAPGMQFRSDEHGNTTR
jgi:hypothetical protein